MIVVVMGVAGSGKSTVAAALADALGWSFVDADDLHPTENVVKMAAGTPLTDADRWPWLRAVADRMAAEEHAAVACSALRRAYRDVLRAGRSDVVCCLLDVDPDELAARLARRTGHFMPASLLADQLAILEPLEADEAGVTVDATGDVPDVVARAGRALGPWS